MKSLLKNLVLSRLLMKDANNEKIYPQQNLQDSPSSGLNEIRVNQNYHGDVEEILSKLPAHYVSGSVEDGKNVYDFERELTDEEIGYINQELEERDVRGYGFRKNTRI